ncbi:MAG: hypothetical protein H0W88_04605 [Parachlamydiaceae bacterium]|nr:hypothetical protein [Parachlamydiaceae bacterium]
MSKLIFSKNWGEKVEKWNCGQNWGQKLKLGSKLELGLTPISKAIVVKESVFIYAIYKFIVEGDS